MKKTEKAAIFIDLANSEELDLKWILNEVKEADYIIEKATCFGDFRQQHLGDLALELYTLGVTMVHCPSWSNGNGNMKRSDDRLLEKSIYETLSKRPSVSLYVIVTSDSDIIPACHSVLGRNKKLALYSYKDKSLGRILKSCEFEIQDAPNRNGSFENTTNSNYNAKNQGKNTGSNNGSNNELTTEQIVRKVDHLEQTSKYLCFMQTVGRVAKCNGEVKKKVQQQLSELIQQGIVEKYEHRIPAIRLNRKHPVVLSSLNNADKAQQQPLPAEELGIKL